MITRRSLLRSFAVAAPAVIITPGLLMPLRGIVVPKPAKLVYAINAADRNSPIGMLVLHTSNERCPEGFIPCDGRLLDSRNYSDLYAVIGQQYGAISDSQSGLALFKVPSFNRYNPILGADWGIIRD